MPDQIASSSFEHQALEADLKQLAVEIGRNRERPELQNSGEKEILKEAIRAFPQPNSASVSPAQPPQPPLISSPLPAYAQGESSEVKLEIEYLMDLALHQGLDKALSEAQKSPYFIQDAFHDALAGKLYPELQKRGIVK